MKRKVLFSLIAVILVFTFVGCNAAYESGVISSESGDSVQNLANTSVSERLIIYDVNISFDVNDLDEAGSFLDGLLADDEWFDQVNLTSSRYSYVIRVKTDRLDDFVTSLQEEYIIRSYTKTGTDISLEYQDTSNQILALEAQMTRLLELYDNASLSDMIVINEQISQIEIELQYLNGELAQYDSLIEYSVVTLVFYGSTVTTQSPFFNRLGNAFVNGFNALISFMDGLIIVFATALPFLVVMGGGAVGLIFILKKRTKKTQPIQKPEDTK